MKTSAFFFSNPIHIIITYQYRKRKFKQKILFPKKNLVKKIEKIESVKKREKKSIEQKNMRKKRVANEPIVATDDVTET